MAKSLLKQRAATTLEELSNLGYLSFGVVFRKSPYGHSATVQCGDWKLASVGGCGYDKESTVVAKFLSPLIHGLPYATGIGHLTDFLAERGWILERTYSGLNENGYKITRSV